MFASDDTESCRDTMRANFLLVGMTLAAFGESLPCSLPGQRTPRGVDYGAVADAYFVPLVSTSRVRAAAVIISDNRGPIFAKTYGDADTGRTLWRAASVTKVLTAIAVMRLVEDGQVSLDTNINQYLRGIRVPDRYGLPITLRQLLAHRSGLDDRFAGDGFRTGESETMHTLATRAFPARVYPPDVVEFYSNYGYAIVGAVLEDVSGERYEDFVTRKVLVPFGMTHSTLAQPLPASAAAAVAPGTWWYQRSSPAGGLTATASDLARLVRATLDSGAGVLTAGSFATLSAPSTAPTGLVHRLGYWTGRDHGQALIGGSGDAGTFHTVLVGIPARRLGLLVIASGSSLLAAWGFYSRFMDVSFGTPDSAGASALRPSPDDANDANSFAGLYRLVRYPHYELAKTYILLDLTHVRAERDGALRFQGKRWIRTGPLQFTSENGSSQVTFARDQRGRIAYLGANERIAWYETGYANIAFYFAFMVWFVVAWARSRGAARWLPAFALIHGVGWLAVVLVIGPANLILGIPLLLQSLLWVGAATPLLAGIAWYCAWRERRLRAFATAALLTVYVPFVFYWNLYAHF